MPTHASPYLALEHALADPRLRDIGALDDDALVAIAREYGLERFLTPPAQNTIAVTSCADSGPGSLRAVMTAAGDGDRIDASALTCSTITLTTGQIPVAANNVTLLGPGPDALTIRSDQGIKYDNRIFKHDGTGTLLLMGVTLADGNVTGRASAADAFGGCVLSNGTVQLGSGLTLPGKYRYDVHVRNCSAIAAQGTNGYAGFAGGGGIYANKVVMFGSTISGCRAERTSGRDGSLLIGGGGGIRARNELRMYSSEIYGNRETRNKYGGGGVAVGNLGSNVYALIYDSTIAGNEARIGGGVTIAGGVARVRNSTLSGNVASDRGGGLFRVQSANDSGSFRLLNSTLTGNRAGQFGGGVALFRTGELQSVLIAGNTPEDIGGDDTTSVTGTNNLIGVSSTRTPALPPGTIGGVDPLLGPLARNGGRTRTHALSPRSPAIDRGNNAIAASYDQRGAGHPRVQGARADIGAFELSDRIFVDGFD
jgi:hypothetical protein